MPIAFIPNDPSITDLPLVTVNPSADRPANRAGFVFSGKVAEKVYSQNTKEFLFWQCREAALRTLARWEKLAGNLDNWARSTNKRKLALTQAFDDPGIIGLERLNAYYDGEGLRFFDVAVKNKTFFTGMSTDTVAHEAGHALLDAIRPDLWDAVVPEAAAFHEAFGDIMAIIVALGDGGTRKKLLKITPDLTKANFVEAIMENLSEGFRLQFGEVAPSKPRRALNTFKWQLPSTLPTGAFEDKPDVLSAEFHSFSRVFSGCYWDTLRLIFAKIGPGETNLAEAVDVTSKLLIEATRTATLKDRLFLEIGRRMVLIDQQQNAGKFREAIKSAFAKHNLGLGTSAMLQPTAALAGEGFDATTGTLPRMAVADLKRRTGAARLSLVRDNVGEEQVTRATYKREIRLDKIHRKLKGVVAFSDESVLIGASGRRAAVLGAVPTAPDTNDEVATFVNTLVDCDQIQYEPMPTKKAAMGLVAARARTRPAVTHAVVSQKGKKVLTRLRFVCACD